jgi:uncharacterized protein
MSSPPANPAPRKRVIITGSAAPAPGPAISSRRDDAAYIVPMAVFMAFIWVGGNAGWYPFAYVARTAIVPVLLWVFWHHYTKIQWTHLGLGLLFGVIGIVQWVGVEELLCWVWPEYWRPGGHPPPFNPTKEFASPMALYAWYAVRTLGPVLVVPVMEELFWRDFVYRTIAAPNDFKMVEVGHWDKTAFLGTAAAFVLVHPQWLTALCYALLIGWLLVKTKSLGACIVCHAVTNLLLAVYVLAFKQWQYW